MLHVPLLNVYPHVRRFRLDIAGTSHAIDWYSCQIEDLLCVRSVFYSLVGPNCSIMPMLISYHVMCSVAVSV